MNIAQLKGFVSEEIAKYHMQKLEYNVVPIGREKLEPELSDLLLFIRGNLDFVNEKNNNSFQVFEKTISKLPDYAVWKTTPNDGKNRMTFRFLEVKYRSAVPKLKLHTSGEKYSLNITQADDDSELLVHKYIENLTNLYRISTQKNESKIDDIEFYIYLITKIDNKHIPLIGKVVSSGYSDFYTYLYTPEQIDKSSFKSLWSNDYKMISDHFMKNGNLEFIFSSDFLIPLLGKPNDYISEAVFKALDNNS